MEILENISLKPYNTFDLDVKAKYFVVIQSKEAFIELTQSEIYQSNEHLILGGGSNILFTKDFEGLVIKNEISGIEVITESENDISIKVGSGEVWHDFVLQCIENNWGGVENLSLIPGTVGAAPIQNIGAYGVEVKDIITEVEYIDLKNFKYNSLVNSECLFDYRYSIFKGPLKGNIFITAVHLNLSKANHSIKTNYGAINNTLEAKNITNASIQDVSEAVIEIRQSKLPDPKEIGNAGSFFKNPIVSKVIFDQFIKNHPEAPSYKVSDELIKIPAGWLIEHAGWKGKVIGNTGSHKNQALVLVNYGEAKGDEVKALAYKIVDSVKQQFGIDIEPEVNII